MESIAAVRALGALAQDTRLAIFRLLVGAGPRGLAAGEIGTRLRVPGPTLSFHLSQLANAGLVVSARQSRSIVYSANFATMNGLLGFLTDDCCGGSPALCLPARQAKVVRPRRRRAVAA